MRHPKEADMKCPVCKTPDLLMTERQGIEIDYCPTCRGVWLDRGELDKFLERLDVKGDMSERGRPSEDYVRRNDDDRRQREYRDEPHEGYRAPRHELRKRRSWFDLFDFD
jgi:Zn-finger nucleic acid-binding protein